MNVVRSLESNASAGVLGFVNGFFGEPEIGPVPVDLGIGFSGHLVAFWAGGELASHLHAFSDGALNAYVVRRAYVAGIDSRARSLRISTEALMGRRAQGLNDDGTQPAGLPAT